jgi:hypothetical protein
MTTLHNYLSRIEATIRSRGDIVPQGLSIEAESSLIGHIVDRLIFHDGSFLAVEEVVFAADHKVEKLRYSYHYQKGDRLIFRYDNAPHHPELPTFPHHKHVDDRVEPCQEPDLQDVLREIDARLYPQPAQS